MLFVVPCLGVFEKGVVLLLLLRDVCCVVFVLDGCDCADLLFGLCCCVVWFGVVLCCVVVCCCVGLGRIGLLCCCVWCVVDLCVLCCCVGACVGLLFCW